MSSSTIVLLLAIAGYSILSISQAGQKVGLHEIPHSPRRGWFIWLLSTSGTVVSFFLILAAIGVGSVALVGAMTGVGMAALTVFSRFVLHEQVGKREIAAVVVIAVGAGLVGVVPLNTDGTARNSLLYWALLVAVVAYVIGAIAAPQRHLRGMILGGLAGSMAAFSQLFQKLGTLTVSWDHGMIPLVLGLITSRPILVSIAITVSSMVVAQIAYTRGQAIQVIPSYTAHASAVPVLGGIIVFEEELSRLHWVGIALLFVGTMVLVAGRRRPE